MTVTMAMVLLGALFIYAGITNKSVSALIKGDNSVTNAGSSTATTSTTAPTTVGTAGSPPSAVSNSGAANPSTSSGQTAPGPGR